MFLKWNLGEKISKQIDLQQYYQHLSLHSATGKKQKDKEMGWM